MKIITSFVLLFSGFVALGAPMESREWQATSGHKTEAKAISATATTVTLELASGKTISLPLEKLVAEDRMAILTHFGITPPKEGDPVRSTATPRDPAKAEHPLGKVAGPIESAPGSNYFIYLPKSLKQDRPAPVLHFNGSGGGNADQMKRYIGGCERFGWILVASKESSNQTHGDPNHKHAANNIAKLRENPLVDPRRIYFTGQSGGGAMSWWNAAKLDGAGTIPFIGYIPKEISISKGHHFIMGGATDYNRYYGGRAAGQFGKDAFYRMYPGGHTFPKDDMLVHEGIAWLTAKYLEENKGDSALAGDRLDFEAAMIVWINELKESDPRQAYHLANMLEETYGISGKNAPILAKISGPLAQSAANVNYHEGLLEMHKFGVKEFGTHKWVGRMNGKNVEAHSRAATRLAEKYADDPFLSDTFTEMALPAQK